MQKHWGIFLGMLKKVGIFFWVDKFWSWDFLGYKIWTSVGPPVIKICEWCPWEESPVLVMIAKQNICSDLKSALFSSLVLILWRLNFSDWKVHAAWQPLQISLNFSGDWIFISHCSIKGVCAVENKIWRDSVTKFVSQFKPNICLVLSFSKTKSKYLQPKKCNETCNYRYYINELFLP